MYSPTVKRTNAQHVCEKHVYSVLHVCECVRGRQRAMGAHHLCPDVAQRAGCVDGQTVGRPSDRPVFLIDRGITETEESAELS